MTKKQQVNNDLYWAFYCFGYLSRIMDKVAADEVMLLRAGLRRGQYDADKGLAPNTPRGKL